MALADRGFLGRHFGLRLQVCWRVRAFDVDAQVVPRGLARHRIGVSGLLLRQQVADQRVQEEAFLGLEATDTIDPEPELSARYAEAYGAWSEILEKQLSH